MVRKGSLDDFFHARFGLRERERGVMHTPGTYAEIAYKLISYSFSFLFFFFSSRNQVTIEMIYKLHDVVSKQYETGSKSSMKFSRKEMGDSDSDGSDSD